MNEYFSLARFYDRLMRDSDYNAWADFVEAIFRRAGASPRSVLDLACGTGVLTCLLAERGYETIGVDLSEEMLMQARERAEASSCPVKPLWICQDLRELDLYGTSDATVCSFDGLNYVPPEDLGDVFRRVSYFTEPGGLFLFDVNTEEKFRRMDGMTYIDEDEDFFCAWRTDLDEEERALIYGVDIFWRVGETWRRGGEEHTEYIQDPERLAALLEENGFTLLARFGELELAPPSPGADRVFYLARNDRRLPGDQAIQ